MKNERVVLVTQHTRGRMENTVPQIHALWMEPCEVLLIITLSCISSTYECTTSWKNYWLLVIPQGFNKLFEVQDLSLSSVSIQLLWQQRTWCVTFRTDRWIFSSYFCHYLFWYFLHFSSNIKSHAERKPLILLECSSGNSHLTNLPCSSRPTSQHCTHMRRWSCWWMLDWMYPSSGTTDSPL